MAEDAALVASVLTPAPVPPSAPPSAPRHAQTVPALNVVDEHNRLNRVLEFPLRKQGAVISLSAGTRDDGVASSRKISSHSVPEGKDALVLLHNGNGNRGDPYFLDEGAEGLEGEDDDDDDGDGEDEDHGEDDVEAAEATLAAGPRVPRVPDGGWGWAVVAAAFFINMASDGISFSFGLLYIEFLRYFGESRSTTSWIGSLFMAVPMLTGPVASAMVDRYGCRAMTILGGIISGIGFVVSAFSVTIGQMYLTFGLLAGLGLGLCFITAVVSIAYWFEKKRTLAMSLGAAGTGFGTFIYAPMTNYFISEYGWRGTVLLLAGTFFNLCVCGVVMRDPSWWVAEQKRARRAECEYEYEAMELAVLPCPCPCPCPALPAAMSRVARSLPYTRATATRSEDNLASAFLAQRQSPVSGPGPGPPSFAHPSVNTIPEVGDAIFCSDDAAAGTPLLSGAASTPATPTCPVPVPGTPVSISRRPGPNNNNNNNINSPLRAESVPCFRRRVSLVATGPLFSAAGAGCRSSSSRGLSSGCANRRSSWRSWCFCPSVINSSDDTTGKRWYSNTLELVRAMLDFSLFLELHFLLMSVATTLLYTWFVVPYFYLADHLHGNGYTEAEASRLLGVVGVANTVGMVVLGWVGDHPRMNVTKTYALCLAVCGTATTCMLIFTTRYWLLVVACAAFGITFASTFSFTPTILVTLVPMERFTIAYGLNLLCQGIGNLLGPPFAGWLFDLTHSWDWSFYMAGLWIVVAGLLTGLIPYTNNRRFFSPAPSPPPPPPPSCPSPS